MAVVQEVAIECHEVTKQYGSVLALQSLSMQVYAGESIAVLGPNGAGKSTLIHTLLGLEQPSSGEVRIGGKLPTDAIRHGFVGSMLQSSHLPPDTSAKEMLSYVRSLYDAPLSQDEVVETAGIASFLSRPIGRLSGGQRRRIEFALAICGNPRLLVLDEPTEGMDLQTRHEFWQRLDRFKKEGSTLFFASHDLAETDKYADEILLLAQGRKVGQGTPAELKQSFALPRVSFCLQQTRPVDEISVRLGCRTTLATGVYTVYAENSDEVLREIVSWPETAYQIAMQNSGLDEVFTHLTDAKGGLSS